MFRVKPSLKISNSVYVVSSNKRFSVFFCAFDCTTITGNMSSRYATKENIAANRFVMLSNISLLKQQLV